MSFQTRFDALNSIIGIMIQAAPPAALPDVLLGIRSARQHFESTSLAQPINEADRNAILAEYLRVEREIEAWLQKQP